MRSVAVVARLSFVVALVALAVAAVPASAQKVKAPRGQGAEVQRGSDEGDVRVERDRRENAEAARGRTSGRADRTASRRGTDDVVVRREDRRAPTRRETSRTDRSQQERIEDILNRRDGDRRDDDWDDYERAGKKGSGPAFCRSGEGHPVHGWAWCEEKGFGRRTVDRRDRDRRWDLDDVIISRPERRTRNVRSGGMLDDVLGEILRGRLYDDFRQSR